MTCCPFASAACGGDSPLSMYDGAAVDLRSSTTSFPSLSPPQDAAPAASLFVPRRIMFFQSHVKSFMWHFHEGHVFSDPDLHLRLFSCIGKGVVQCTQCSVSVAPIGIEAGKSHPCTTMDLMPSCMSSHGNCNK